MKNKSLILITGLFIFYFPSVFYAVPTAKRQKELLEHHPKAIWMVNYYDRAIDGNPKRRGYDLSKVVEIPIRTRIFDVSKIAYSKSFSDRYGYPEKFITDELSPGIQAMEFRMEMGRRADSACYINLYMEPDDELDFPEGNFVQLHSPGGKNGMRFPKTREGWKAPKSDIEYDKKGNWKDYTPTKEAFAQSNRENYYNQNILFATSDYKFQKKGGGTNLTLKKVIRTYINDLDYVSIYFSCGAHMQKFVSQPNIQLWMKKKGGLDYTKNLRTKRRDFKKYNIPSHIREDMLKYMKLTGEHNWDAVRRWEKTKEEEK